MKLVAVIEKVSEYSTNVQYMLAGSNLEYRMPLLTRNLHFVCLANDTKVVVSDSEVIG